MKSVAKNIAEFKKQLPDHVTLVAVSKTKPVALIEDAYSAGQRDFGENKVQELTAKIPVLPADIRWHLIGHLQTNKVKYIADAVHLIHAVDSENLLAEINKQAVKHNKTISVLLQLHIAKEETKFGLSEQELHDLLNAQAKGIFPNVKIKGLMGMATNTEDEQLIRSEFRSLRKLFEATKTNEWDTLSMGMSSDWKIAIEEGSTMIRIGSALFGERHY
ncbi:MAG: YggS family pyridoxal phosphate-dependent enzyme [Bacteroidetes bacterium]|jgi:pyridoxal phosphate enzyme (YggS family)|nr:YggS family pyridoxal phosphate-dependent enzyme [Bacteroidota bacterium]